MVVFLGHNYNAKHSYETTFLIAGHDFFEENYSNESLMGEIRAQYGDRLVDFLSVWRGVNLARSEDVIELGAIMAKCAREHEMNPDKSLLSLMKPYRVGLLVGTDYRK